MVVVVENFLKRATIDHRLIPLKTRTLFSFECLDRDGAKLDALHRPPRIAISFENLDPIETASSKAAKKTSLVKGPEMPPPQRSGAFFISFGTSCSPATS